MTKATFTWPFESLRDRACLFCGGIFSSFLQTSTEPWRDFFLFLADQYRAMEGDLATRRFPKGIYDPLKNPWRDFSRARQSQKQVPQKIRSYCKTILSLVMEVFRIALKRLFRSSMVRLSFTVSYDAYFEKELYSGKGRRSKKKEGHSNLH